MTPDVKTSVGDSELAAFFNRLKQNVVERTPLDGENYKVVRTPKGFRLIIAPKKATQSDSSRPVWL